LQGILLRLHPKAALTFPWELKVNLFLVLLVAVAAEAELVCTGHQKGTAAVAERAGA